jgi:hypothetical protein
MPKLESAQIATEIKKIYADARKAGKFVPPPVARAMALAKLSGRRTGPSTLVIRAKDRLKTRK